MGELKKLVLVKYKPKPKPADHIDHLFPINKGHKLGYKWSSFKFFDPFASDNNPAAMALYEIGLPAAGSICYDISMSKGKMDTKRIEIYADILSSILMEHTDSFLREGRSHAPKSSFKLYDKFLAMPPVKSVTSSDRWYSEPDDETKPVRKTRIIIIDGVKVKEAIPVESKQRSSQ